MMRFEKFLGKMKTKAEGKRTAQPVKNQPNVPVIPKPTNIPKIPKLNDLSLSVIVRCPHCQEQVEVLETDFDIGFIEIHKDKVIFTFHPGNDIVCEKCKNQILKTVRNYRVYYSRKEKEIVFEKLEELKL